MIKLREQDAVGVHFFIAFFQNCNHIKAQATDEAVFMSTREHVLLEEVSRCSLYSITLEKCYYSVPSTKHNFCRIC